MKRPFVTLGLVLAGGCGGPSLDPSASESVERLPPGPQRSAGDAIVAYDTAVRAKDAAWGYRRPWPLARRVKGRIAFCNGVAVHAD